MSFPITHFLWLIFNLPNGSIWSNLWANLIWIPIVGVTTIVVHSKVIKKIDARFDEHHKQVDAKLEAHHEEIRRMVDGSQGQPSASAIQDIS